MNHKSFLVGAVASALFLLPSQLPAGAAALHFIGDTAATQSVDFSIKLPLRNSAELDQLINLQSSPGSPLYHHFLKPAQFRESFGPAAATISKAEAALRASGFTITRVESQVLHVRGTSAAINRAFGTRLGVMSDVGQRVRFAARTPLVIPRSLAVLGAKVTSLSATMRPRPMFAKAAPAPANRYSKLGGYWFDDFKQAYSYPAYGVANGKGVTVATVGFSDFNSSDADAYFANEKLGKGGLAPEPNIEHLLLPGSLPFDPNSGASDEADLDVQQVAGSAPGATVLGISIYGPGEPFLDAYSFIDDYNAADIVSTSYGDCELYYTAPWNGGVDYTGILQSYHDIFRQGNSQGITFVFSSGDNSGTQCAPPAYLSPPTGKIFHTINHGAGIWVDDPNVTGVGGTNLVTTYSTGSPSAPGPLKSEYVSENETADRVLNPVDLLGTGNYLIDFLWGSGGGPSSIFAKPSFQKLVPTGYGTRTVPDVAMQMGGCPGYIIDYLKTCDLVNRDSSSVAVIGGELVGLIGTSSSAPEFAGLLAVRESVTGSRMGNANEYIYKLAADNAKGKYFRQGIYSYNGIVHVAKGHLGYTPIVGVGTPIAKNFVGLPDVLVAGDPQSSTNP